jgi:hypothetical protein
MNSGTECKYMYNCSQITNLRIYTTIMLSTFPRTIPMNDKQITVALVTHLLVTHLITGVSHGLF